VPKQILSLKARMPEPRPSCLDFVMPSALPRSAGPGKRCGPRCAEEDPAVPDEAECHSPAPGRRRFQAGMRSSAQGAPASPW